MMENVAGLVNLADGLETHVYDKDGKTKIITWSTNTNNTISIPYENFTASGGGETKFL